MKGLPPQPRAAVSKFRPYVAGTSIEEVKAKYGLTDIVKLASNENLWGTSPAAVKEARKELENLYLYPVPDSPELKKKISKKYNISEDCIITGNGTDELIELIALTFISSEDNIVVSENSFIRYKMAAELMGAPVKEVPQKNFVIDPEGMLKQIDISTKVVYIDNPCNPTGTYISAAQMDYFIGEVEKMDSPPLLVFDEAYYGYAHAPDYVSALVYSQKKIPMIVLRTFSKIYGLAGLRIGYGMSSAAVMELINRVRPPFNTNRIAQAAAAGALDDNDFLENISRMILEEKKYFYAEMKKLGLNYIPSETNFVMVEIGKDKVGPFCGHLLKKGMILRPLAGYKLDDFVRITIGKREHNERLVRELSGFLGKVPEDEKT
jgi:histidinol-phosphate aminotransferase